VKLDVIRRATSRHTLAAFEWGGVDTTLLAAAIEAAVADNGAILFGVTRAGDTRTVTLFDGRDKETFYVGSLDEAEGLLNTIACHEPNR